MKQFCCGDVVPGCTATFRRDTEDELMSAVAAHARRDHGMNDVPAAVAAQVRARITDVQAA